MFSLLGDVKGLIKLDKLCIDNNVFRLHYKVSGCLSIRIVVLILPSDTLYSSYSVMTHFVFVLSIQIERR